MWPIGYSHVAVPIDHSIFITSGVQRHPTSRDLNYLPGNVVWVHHVASYLWERIETKGDVPPRMEGACGVGRRGKLYLWGGDKWSGYNEDLFSFHPRSKEWKKVEANNGDKPAGRADMICWVDEESDEMRVWGGVHFGGKPESGVPGGDWNDGYTNQYLAYAFESKEWKNIQVTGRRPTPRKDMAMAKLGRKVYMIGGRGVFVKNEFWILNLETDSWHEIKVNGQDPGGRGKHSLNPINENQLIFIGGYGIIGRMSRRFSDVWMFDIQANEWRRQDNVPDVSLGEGGGLSDHRSVTIKKQDGKESILVFGGKTNGKPYQLKYKLEFNLSC
jgi:hypothetical protein